MALKLAKKKQQRLDALMTKNNDGHLKATERDELQILVHETEVIMLANARLLLAEKLSAKQDSKLPRVQEASLAN